MTVSIGIPCYNRPDTLRKVIDGFLNQTYTDIELIISDNASTDPRVRRLLEGYIDPRLKVFYQTVNIGLYANYSFVFKQATGKYFVYGADDDIWEPDFIELLVNELENHHEHAFVIPRTQFIDENGNIVREFAFDINILSFILSERTIFVWSAMWRRELLQQFLIDGDYYAKDIILAVESLLSYSYGYVDKLLYKKTIYHNKARVNPILYFGMYSRIIYRVLISKCVKHKSILFILIPLFCIELFLLFLVQLIYYPIRGKN